MSGRVMVRGKAADPPEVRFWRYVEQRRECWVWTASIRPNGYGEFRCNGRLTRAHRFAYEQMVGPVPEGLQLDHLCRNRACVNPEHLEPVTGSVNVQRGHEARSRERLPESAAPPAPAKPMRPWTPRSRLLRRAS